MTRNKRDEPIIKQWRGVKWRRQLKRETHSYLLTCEVCLERDEEGRPLLVGYGHSVRGRLAPGELLRLTFGNLRQMHAFTGWDCDKHRFVCQARWKQPCVFVGINEYLAVPRFQCRRKRLPPRPPRPQFVVWRQSAPLRRLDAFAHAIVRP